MRRETADCVTHRLSAALSRFYANRMFHRLLSLPASRLFTSQLQEKRLQTISIN